MKEVFKKYQQNDIKLAKWQIISIICLIIVIAGMFGWIYEVIFYFFNGGMQKIYWRGGNFLPWINIYATGSIMIILLTHKLRKHPLLVFLIAVISTGILEYLSGLIIYELKDGLRLWDYNTEILNFGNIGGFVCLRSVTFFGISALFLMYFILPFCIYLSQKIKKKTFLIISISLCTIFMFDEFYNLIFARVWHLPRSTEVYKSLGFNYMNYYENNKAKGVTMQIKEGTLTNIGATVIITDISGKNNIYGESYKIEKYENNKWKELNPIIKESYFWNDIGYTIGPDNKLELNIQWKWLYGELPEGKYKLTKETSSPKETAKHYVSVEFEIDNQ